MTDSSAPHSPRWRPKCHQALLAIEDVETDGTDHWGDTLLSIAILCEYYDVAVLLIEEDANPNRRNVDLRLQTLFLAAVELGSIVAV